MYSWIKPIDGAVYVLGTVVISATIFIMVMGYLTRDEGENYIRKLAVFLGIFCSHCFGCNYDKGLRNAKGLVVRPTTWRQWVLPTLDCGHPLKPQWHDRAFHRPF